jgi:hypothetical protein
VRPDGENFAFEPINELTEPSLNLAER